MQEIQDIKNARELAEHEQRLVNVEHRVKNLESMQNSMNNLIRSVDKLAFNMEGMLTEQKRQGERLKKLEQEPADDWKSMRRTIITTIVGVISGALASGLLLMISQNL